MSYTFAEKDRWVEMQKPFFSRIEENLKSIEKSVLHGIQITSDGTMDKMLIDIANRTRLCLTLLREQQHAENVKIDGVSGVPDVSESKCNSVDCGVETK